MPVQRIRQFDVWRPRYGNALVTVYQPNTTTKITLYADEAMTIALDNPQRLLSASENGIQYGKWAQPVYVNSDFQLDIDGTDQTGIERLGLQTMTGEDGSGSLVTPTGGSQSNTLAELFSRVIHAEDHGVMSTVTAGTTNATLVAAIGAAAADGGGIVLLPEGTYPFTGFTLSAGVILMGRGRTVTNLQCQTAGNCITMGGDRSGMVGVTVDGVSLVTGGRGMFMKAIDQTYMRDVELKNFDIGLYAKGGRKSRWYECYVDGCNVGAQLHGDLDTGGGSDGDEFRDNFWRGGLVSNCVNIGVDVQNIDKAAEHLVIAEVGFDTNTGIALNVVGARQLALPGCWWVGNTTDLDVQDHATPDDTNTVRGLHISDGIFDSGAINLDDTLLDVVLERCSFIGNTITLTSVGNTVLTIDSYEDSAVALAGDTTKWTRWRNANRNEVVGTTSDATATKAWSVALEPGQVVYAEAKVIANQTNGISTAEYHISVSAERPGSALDYDAQTVNFTVGATLTGGNSGATALIVADADSGATGTLTIRKISGTFEDNEPLTDSSGGAATANGTQTDANVALLGAVTSIRAAREDVAGWNATFVANGPELEVQVTGAAATNIDWLVSAELVG